MHVEVPKVPSLFRYMKHHLGREAICLSSRRTQPATAYAGVLWMVLPSIGRPLCDSIRAVQCKCMACANWHHPCLPSTSVLEDHRQAFAPRKIRAYSTEYQSTGFMARREARTTPSRANASCSAIAGEGECESSRSWRCARRPMVVHWHTPYALTNSTTRYGVQRHTRHRDSSLRSMGNVI